MKKKKIFILSSIAALVIGAIVAFNLNVANQISERILNKGFPEKTILKAEKIKIKEVLKAGAIVLLKDYIIIQNEYISNEDCFFVYTKDKVKFCYSFGRLGQSGTNDEFIAPRVIQNNSGNTFAVFDQATRKIYYYQISQEEFTLTKKGKINENDELPLQEFSFVNDSILLFSTTDNEICSYNLITKNIIDRKRFETDISGKEVVDSNPNFESFHFCNYKNKIAVGFRFINRVITGELDENYCFKFNREKIKSDIIYFGQEDFDKNTYYYMYLASTDKYIFSEYLGLPFKSLQPFPLNLGARAFNFFMLEVYNWEMNKIALLEFDHNVLRFIIDEENGCMYTWDPLDDFDYLYKYSFDGI